MVLKAKKEAPAPPTVEAKAKALKAKKVALKGVHSHTEKRYLHVTHLPSAQDTEAPRQPKYPQKSTPRRNQLDHCGVITLPRPPSQP
ncbi:hypothetical protein HPG69_013164 [Diceros bicornis minor]|uniref:Large ribosomal subunit protein uL23 N-terminal domain-containing protein n=1 Tax=Diceros bicornis minor TaxID=77932 RepID=A0A7J7F452_DICBM|nr:hypothetical protein HPG69_013164 [Diceros bicornis minor]